MAKLLEAQIHEETKLWSLIVLCLSRSKYARKEQWKRGKQSEENRGQQLQSSFALLEHFPKSIFYMLYTISKLRKSRIQRFKPSKHSRDVFSEDEWLGFCFLCLSTMFPLWGQLSNEIRCTPSKPLGSPGIDESP
ncbi:hypothetical protein AAG906_019627 [Vitis piasezkii]